MSTEVTGGDPVCDLVNEISASVYVEAIIVDKVIGVGTVGTGPCDRVCSDFERFEISRELFDPKNIKKVRSALCFKGRSPSDYTPYYRDFSTNVLTLADYDDPIETRKSLVFLDDSLTDNERAFVLNHFATHREILPARMVK